jgi:uncharacterized protein (DUF1501 family)
MLRVLGHPSAACDRLTRRDLLRAGTLAAFGAAFAPTVPASEGKPKASADAVILIDLFGGPSHIDTFDPKPDAPAEIRGEFGTIATPLAGVRFTEHVPQLAKRLEHSTLIRTVSHGYNSHNPYAVMTGYAGGQDQTDYHAKPTNHPSIPSVCQYLGVGRGGELPGYVMLPAFPGYSQGLRRAGPYGGYLGPKYDPLFSTCEPTWAKPKVDFYDHDHTPMGEPTLPKCDSGLSLDALNGRRSLVEQLDSARRVSGDGLSGKRAEAFELLTSAKARAAFDLSRESPRTRDRYGRDLFGSSTLLARRLVQAGVPFVTVHTEAAQGNGHWDTHSNNFRMLKNILLPYLDRAVSALLDDLRETGLLARTLVVVNGDMGRTPKVNASAGRDHWPQCGFALLAGGGVKAGCVYGKSDKSGGYPVEHPVSAGDLAATIYHAVGVDPEATVPDQTGRPTHVSHGGSVVTGVLA